LDISKALERLKRINLKGGVFGKTTILLIVLCICVSVVCISTKVWWMALVLMVPLMGMIFYALKRCFDFAEANPQAAIMEGAEFLVHEKLLFREKDQVGYPLLDVTVVDHEAPALPAAEVAQADEATQELPVSQGSTEGGQSDG
jgi:hypothetical protein